MPPLWRDFHHHYPILSIPEMVITTMKEPNEKSDGPAHGVANGAPQHSKSSARMSEKATVGGFQWTGACHEVLQMY
jgi:hypothetical protein